ncbi:MAG: response regulator [Polyangiaceae bacterium]
MSAGSDERPRVLIVDDEKFIRDILADFLGMEGYQVRTAEDGAAALEELSRGPYDLILSDLKMPRMGGIELLQKVSEHSPSALTVIMTGFGTVETAIDAMKRGAYDYILKPFKMEEVIHVVQRGLEKQRLATENLRLKEALSLYKVSEAIQASLSLDEVMGTLASTSIEELGADRVSVWLDDGEGGYKERACLVAPNASGTPIEASCSFKAKDVLARLSEQGAILEHGQKSLAYFDVAPEFPLTSLLVLPLRGQARTFGFVAAMSFSQHKRFDEGQRKHLFIVASRAAAAVENARLYEDLQATFQQTIQGLAAAIDKMDRYTAGHSDRVATYAMYLATRLGLPPDIVEVVRQSALMHDIGKIGCVMNLNKPGKLTQDEYEGFKKHPTFGRDILDPIKFLHPLIPGVHLHHERWDGRGYPLGLKGHDIPIVARIIAVADTYDAMTSDRAYRQALPHEVAVTEIDRCVHTQFDPEVANSFTEHLDTFRDELIAKGVKVPE